MSAVSLRLPESLYREAQRLAQSDGISLNQLIVTALSEKLAVLETESYLKERADRGDRAAFDSVLSRVDGTREPVAGDRLRPISASVGESVVRESDSGKKLYDASLVRHRWSEDDDLIVYGLYRLGDKALGMQKNILAEILGMGLASLNYKIGNFKYLDTGKGLEGYSRQARRVYEARRDLSDVELRAAVIEAMARELNGDD